MMGRTQKILATVLWSMVVVAMLVFVATRTIANRAVARSSARIEHNAAAVAPQGEKFEPMYDVPDFELFDQNAKPFDNKKLLGSVWVADFVFTHCAGPCPIMTSKMADLQRQVDRPDVKLVTFSVDPERDSPQVLKQYARRFGADESRWSFLTGSKETIFNTAAGMKIVAIEAKEDQPILHSERFLLIDRAGKIVAVYRSSDEDEMNRLAADTIELAEKTK